VSPIAVPMRPAPSIAQLRRELAAAERKSAKAAEARSSLPPGSSRARVTTANARWARAAEARDLLARRIEELEAEAQLTGGGR
jgi:hypothetical protein